MDVAQVESDTRLFADSARWASNMKQYEITDDDVSMVVGRGIGNRQWVEPRQWMSSWRCYMCGPARLTNAVKADRRHACELSKLLIGNKQQAQNFHKPTIICLEREVFVFGVCPMKSAIQSNGPLNREQVCWPNNNRLPLSCRTRNIRAGSYLYLESQQEAANRIVWLWLARQRAKSSKWLARSKRQQSSRPTG